MVSTVTAVLPVSRNGRGSRTSTPTRTIPIKTSRARCPRRMGRCYRGDAPRLSHRGNVYGDFRIALAGSELDRKPDGCRLAPELLLDLVVLGDPRDHDPERRAAGALDPRPREPRGERLAHEGDGVRV